MLSEIMPACPSPQLVEQEAGIQRFVRVSPHSIAYTYTTVTCTPDPVTRMAFTFTWELNAVTVTQQLSPFRQ